MYSATGISYYQDVKQGRMASYHSLDPSAPGLVHPAEYNTAVLLDTDSTYHHTDRVAHHDFPAQPEKAPGTVRFHRETKILMIGNRDSLLEKR